MSENRKSEERTPLLRVGNVSKRFFLTKALDNVSFDIEKGVIVGLLGPNGSGKSTLLKSIIGLYRPTSGMIMVNGRIPDRKTKTEAAYLPEIDHLYPWMTVQQTIDFVSSFYEDWDDAKAQKLLDLVDIRKPMLVGKLSRGQRARLKLVLVLSRNASLILLDEPLSGIDPPSRIKIINAIVSEFRSEEQTIILSTHEVAEAESIFDTVVFLDKGRVRLIGDAEDIRVKYGTSIQGLLEEVYA